MDIDTGLWRSDSPKTLPCGRAAPGPSTVSRRGCGQRGLP